MTRISTRSATPAAAARSRATRACGSESVIPTTSAPWRTAAWTAKLPQPQPMSRTRSPACSASFVQTISSFASWASSSAVAPREKMAQL